MNERKARIEEVKLKSKIEKLENLKKATEETISEIEEKIITQKMTLELWKMVTKETDEPNFIIDFHIKNLEFKKEQLKKAHIHYLDALNSINCELRRIKEKEVL